MAVTNETDNAILQKDLKLLEEWENRSQMSFHPDNCDVNANVNVGILILSFSGPITVHPNNFLTGCR